MRILLLILLGLLLGNDTLANWSDLNFKRITVEHGLSQSTVKCILKDSRGYMWFGTRDGLNRYDGYTFKVFKQDPQTAESLSSNFITDLLQDRAGNLWVGTNNGFCKFDPLTETFQRYHINNASVYIADLFEDSRGTIWIGTNGGLYEFDVTTSSYKAYRHEAGNANSLIDSGINKITEDQQGNLWIATPRALERYDPKTKIFTHYQHEPANSKSIGEGFIISVFNNSANQIWVATTTDGISRFNPADNSFTRFKHDPQNSNSLSHNDVLSFAEDTEGRLWVGTQNGGISILNPRTGEFRNYTFDITNPKSLGGISIHALYKDDIGNIWIGTWASGVSLWSRYGDKFRHYATILDLNSTNVYAITGDSAGKIWLGVEEGGLVSFDPQRHRFKKHANEHEQYFNTKVILSIAEHNEDTLLIGYHIGGFAFYNKNTGQFTHFRPDPSDQRSIYGIVKPSILKDSQNNIWIGDWGGGLSLYSGKERGFTNFHHNAQDTKALSNGVVFALYEDRAGNLWIGTEGGLNLLNRKTRQFTRFQKNDSNKHSISHNTIHTIFEDSRGNMWVGTAGGLNLFDRKNKTFTAYTEKDGLPNNVINGILEDDHGNLWLSTNQGISQFNIDTKKCRNYDTSDGLQGNEYNRNACYKAADGRMYFGGNRGFNVFHPDSIQDNPYVPPVVLSDIQIFNESVNVGSPGSILQQAINLTKEIFLNYQHSVVTLHYASLNFITPEKNQYAYQLKGFDKDWNFVGNKRLATYTNLDPGTYTFRVIASNNDGIWNEQGASLVINILPPFWGTWWFRLLAILLVVGMGIFFYSYRLHSIKRLNQKLMVLVDERTRELVYKQDQINAQNEALLGVNEELSSKQEEVASQRDMLAMQNQELSEVREKIIAQNLSLDQEVKERTRELVDYNQQLEQFAFIAAHNLRAPVARVLGLGQLLKLPNVSLEEKKAITEKMAYTAEELDQVVKDINTILEIRKNNTLSITEINLSQEVALVKENLLNEINCTQAEIFEDYTQGNTLKTVKPYLDSILLNLISNAIKFRDPNRKPRIDIKTIASNDYLCLQVTDNGLGIDLAAHKKNLFALYKRFHSHVEGKGMGLYLVKTQVDALGGKIEVESQVNEGTRFKIFLKNNSK